MDANRRFNGATRRQFLVRAAAGVSVTAALGMLSACQLVPGVSPASPGATGSPAVRRGGTASLVLNQPPDSFIPQFYLTAYSRFSYQMLYAALMTWSPDDLEPKGWLADRWEISPDATTYTFHIRENAVWTDGTPITAEDVEFTILAMSDPAYAGLERVLVTPVAGVAQRRAGTSAELSGVRVLDPKTVEIRTTEPFVSLVHALGAELFILPKHALQDVPIAEMTQDPFALNPRVTSGPFKFVRYETNQFLEMEANDDYFLGRPNLDKVIVKILGGDVALVQLERGELDMIPGLLSSIRPLEVERIERLEHVEVMPLPGNFLSVLVFNLANPRLQDVRLRRAIAHAIDAKAIVDTVFRGYGSVNRLPNAAHFPYYSEQVAAESGYDYDPDKARTLLRETGWDPATELVVRHSPALYPDVSPVVQAQLADVGIKLRIEQGELGPILGRVRDEPEWLELGMWGYRGFLDPDTFMTRIYHTDTAPAPNYSRYSNPKVDELLLKGRSLADPAQRQPVYEEIYRLILEDVPLVPLFVLDEIGARNKRLQGVVPTIIRLTDNMHEWYVTD